MVRERGGRGQEREEEDEGERVRREGKEERKRG